MPSLAFPQYEYHKFDESNGVDRFLKEMKIGYAVESTHFFTPSAFMVKKRDTLGENLP